jgi:glycosyltransferase involved in cell wall biosynthesis
MRTFPRPSAAYVLPVFDESETLAAFHAALDAVAARLADRYDVRFLYVDDGSTDGSLEQLHRLAEGDSRITVLALSRNFGHQIAVTAGLDAVDADAVIVMDTDLQDPPEVSLELIERWEQGFDVVYAQRRSRQDGAFKVVTARLFYRALRRLSDIDIPPDAGDFRLLDRRVVDELRRFREHDRFLRGLVSYVGFRQTGVPFDRDGRFAGRTHYPLRRMLRFAADGIVGFSAAPLRVISRIGYAVSTLSLLGVLYVLGVKLLVPEAAVPGWAFLDSAMIFLGGVQIVMLGVLGTYIGRIHTEVQGRPLYSVAAVLPAAAPNVVRDDGRRPDDSRLPGDAEGRVHRAASA